MADEFVKGLGLLTGAGLLWMVFAGWYRTPKFEGAQLIGKVSQDLTALDQMALQFMEAMFWLAVFGALFFWIGVPAGRELKDRLQGE